MPSAKTADFMMFRNVTMGQNLFAEQLFKSSCTVRESILVKTNFANKPKVKNLISQISQEMKTAYKIFKDC